MMDGFLATLEARDPSLGRMRSYHLEVSTDLFGACGRRGIRPHRRPGRRIRYALENKDKARKLVRQSLRRRATARKRIGVSYCFRELIDLNDWYPSPFEQISSASQNFCSDFEYS